MRRSLALATALLAVLPAAFARPDDPEPAFRALPEVRTIDGTGNHATATDRGAAGTPLRRLLDACYADGVSAPAGADRPGARELSNLVVAQSADLPSAAGVSDLFWQWGQFLDHDIVLTPVAEEAEDFSIPVPAGDPSFDPAGTGTAVIPMDRSYREMVDGVGEQVNDITAWIDASGVYGSDDARAATLRRNDGTGRLRTSGRRMLPHNRAGLPNAPSAERRWYLAGDFRANEQVGLTALHTLFVREHNHWARRIARDLRRQRRRPGGRTDPDLPRGREETDEAVYQLARAIVGAEIQAVTYREFLPLLLGPGALAPESGYDPDADARISNEFAAAAYRLGHSMLSGTIRRLNRFGATNRHGDLSLAEAFFQPRLLPRGGGIDPVLRGLAVHRAQTVDVFMVDEVRNLLFGPPGAGGLDLAALNIQRGRDHGLPSYVETRAAFGLGTVEDFDDITSDPALEQRLRDAHGTVDRVDLWVGGLAEDRLPGAMVGPTLHGILKEQFEALRDGDRFWYRRHLPPALVELVEEQTLVRIIHRNTRIGAELPADIWHAE